MDAPIINGIVEHDHDYNVEHQEHDLLIHDHDYAVLNIENDVVANANPIGPAAVTCYNQDIRTNNYVESYHASLLKLIKPHPKVWEFLNQLQFLENQNFVEFCQSRANLNIRNGVPTRARTNNTNAIRDFLQKLSVDEEPNRILTFLRRAGHRVDGYIAQEIGHHPGEEELLLAGHIM